MNLIFICKKVFIIITLVFIMLSTIFVTFIPFLYCLYIFIFQLINKLDLLELAVISGLMLFGGLFISLAISYKILEYFDNLFHFEKHYQSNNPNQRGHD